MFISLPLDPPLLLSISAALRSRFRGSFRRISQSQRVEVGSTRRRKVLFVEPTIRKGKGETEKNQQQRRLPAIKTEPIAVRLLIAAPTCRRGKL
ncbi:unnamed protein product [Closterium sp. NIES-53]